MTTGKDRIRKTGKLRSGVKSVRWANYKKGKRRIKSSNNTTVKCEKNNMSKFMDIIMLQVTKDDKHAQVSVPEGIRRHGDKALDALLKEFGQVHKYDTFDPQHMHKLTPE